MKKKLFSVLFLFLVLVVPLSSVHADVVAQPKYSESTMLLIFKILGISESDANTILSILYPVQTNTVTQTTNVTSSQDVQVANPTISQSVPSVPESANFSISTTDKGTYVVFQENNADNVTMQGIVYKMPSGGYVNDASGQLYECSDILSSWANYPYTCPTTNGNYETKSYQDNFGRSTPFDLLSGVTMPEGTTIYYYKAVDSSGKSYEYTAS